jgi:hypothetical protein
MPASTSLHDYFSRHSALIRDHLAVVIRAFADLLKEVDERYHADDKFCLHINASSIVVVSSTASPFQFKLRLRNDCVPTTLKSILDGHHTEMACNAACPPEAVLMYFAGRTTPLTLGERQFMTELKTTARNAYVADAQALYGVPIEIAARKYYDSLSRICDRVYNREIRGSERTALIRRVARQCDYHGILGSLLEVISRHKKLMDPSIHRYITNSIAMLAGLQGFRTGSDVIKVLHAMHDADSIVPELHVTAESAE